MATTLMLAVQYKADVRGIAIVQTVRVVAIALLLPTAIALFGLTGAPLTVAAALALRPPG